MNKLVYAAFGLAAVLVACPDPPKPPTPKPPSDTVAESPAKPSGTVGSITDLINGTKALESLPNTTGSSLQSQFNSIGEATISCQPMFLA
jgi:hypothetical protein